MSLPEEIVLNIVTFLSREVQHCVLSDLCKFKDIERVRLLLKNPRLLPYLYENYRAEIFCSPFDFETALTYPDDESIEYLRRRAFDLKPVRGGEFFKFLLYGEQNLHKFIRDYPEVNFDAIDRLSPNQVRYYFPLIEYLCAEDRRAHNNWIASKARRYRNPLSPLRSLYNDRSYIDLTILRKFFGENFDNFSFPSSLQFVPTFEGEHYVYPEFAEYVIKNGKKKGGYFFRNPSKVALDYMLKNHEIFEKDKDGRMSHFKNDKFEHQNNVVYFVNVHPCAIDVLLEHPEIIMENSVICNPEFGELIEKYPQYYNEHVAKHGYYLHKRVRSAKSRIQWIKRDKAGLISLIRRLFD